MIWLSIWLAKEIPSGILPLPPALVPPLFHQLCSQSSSATFCPHICRVISIIICVDSGGCRGLVFLTGFVQVALFNLWDQLRNWIRLEFISNPALAASISILVLDPRKNGVISYGISCCCCCTHGRLMLLVEQDGRSVILKRGERKGDILSLHTPTSACFCHPRHSCLPNVLPSFQGRFVCLSD